MNYHSVSLSAYPHAERSSCMYRITLQLCIQTGPRVRPDISLVVRRRKSAGIGTVHMSDKDLDGYGGSVINSILKSSGLSVA
jgi:hypothetical protein